MNPKLALKQKNTTHGLAASRNATAVVSSSSSSADEQEEEEASAANAAKAASLGGGYSMFAAANGVPSPSASSSSSSSSSWVSASNVTLPSNIGVAKRSSVSPEETSKQHLKKRVVPHPGEPSATIKVNVVGGDTYQNFTIIASETGKSSASSSKTSTSIKTAQTGINVNIVHNGTGSAANDDEEDETLLTFTFTLPLDVLAASTSNDTVTLVPAGNDSYIPYINNKKVSSLTTEDDNDDSHKATCTVPVDDEVLLAVAKGQTFYSSCVNVDAVAKKIRVKVDVSIASSSSSSSDEDESDSNSKAKRQTIAYFQSPAFKNEKLNKRQMVAFFKAPDHGPEVLPPSSSAQEEDVIQNTISYTKEEMMSDLWEDCIVGIDEGCLEIPEQ